MIDWLNLGANALWIIGLALGLAVFSYASWQASVNKEKLREAINQPGVQVGLHAAGILFCLGLAASSGALWEKAAWLVLGLLFLIQMIWTGRNKQD